MTISGTTTPDKSGPGSNGSKGVLRISQSSSITGASSSFCLVSCLGHTVTFSRAWNTQPIRGVMSSLTIPLASGCKRWHPLAPGRRYRARSSPLSEDISLHLSLKHTTNCVPLSRIKWEIYIFIKKCVSFRSLKFVHYLWLCYWLGLWE